MHKLNYPLLLGTLIFILCVPGKNAQAQWNGDPSLNTAVCTTAGTHQFQPQLAPDGNGGAYITWMEAPDFNSSSQIFAQHLSANGNRLWPAAGIPVTPVPGLYSQVQVVTAADGSAVICWINTAGATIRHYVQKISPGGQLQWNGNGIAVCSSEITQLFFYQLLGDGNGGAIVLWDDQRNGPNEVFAQRIGADGTAQWPAAGVSCSSPFTNYSSYDAVADSSGGLMLCWSVTTGLISRNDIFVQHIDGMGLAQWGSQGINISAAAPSDQLYCKIATDGHHNIIVSWQDFRLDPARSQLYGQRISQAGNVLWAAGGLLLADSVVAASTVSKLVTDTMGGVQLAWIDKFLPFPSTTAHLMAVRADSMGNIITVKKEIASWQDLQMPVDFKFVPDYRGGAFASWEQPNSIPPAGNAYEIYDVYAQHLLADGSTEFPLAGKAVSTAPMTQYYQQMICDSNAVAILTWSDIRNGADFDVYASALSVQSALPVHWLSFSGNALPSSVLLQWETAYEINNKEFIIQRSADGIHFDNIGTTAATNSTGPSAYRFTDNHPLQGTGFYRLNQSDYDGKTTYSRTIRVDTRQIQKISLYPNPASNQLILEGSITNAFISIYAGDGVLVKEIHTGNAPINKIDISTMASGIYFVKITDAKNNKSYMLPFIKQ